MRTSLALVTLLAALLASPAGTGGARAADPTPTSPTPAASEEPAPPAGALTAVCLELAVALLADPSVDGSGGEIGSLPDALAAAASSIRSASVPRGDRPVRAAIADELDRLAGQAARVDDAAEPADALEAVLRDLDAANAFAATTSLGPFLTCAPDPAIPEAPVVILTTTTDGLALDAQPARGWSRLQVRNDRPDAIAVQLLAVVPGVEAAELTTAFGDGADPTPLLLGEVAALDAIVPGALAEVPVLLDPGRYAVVGVPDGADTAGPEPVVLVFDVPADGAP